MKRKLFILFLLTLLVCFLVLTLIACNYESLTFTNGHDFDNSTSINDKDERNTFVFELFQDGKWQNEFLIDSPSGELLPAPIVDTEGYWLVDYVGNIHNVVIPETYQNKKVVGILNYCFMPINENASNYHIESIVLSEGIKEIKEGAFYKCDSLKTIEIAKSIESIEKLVFAGCDSLEVIEVDKENETYHSEGNCIIETETNSLIAGCKTSIIPNDGSVSTICENAFSNCRSLESIDIPDTVLKIENKAFDSCISLNTIRLPNNGIYIHSSAFNNCENIKTATMPISLIEIIPKANLNILILNSNESIYSQAFKDCPLLMKITIPDGVTSIGDEAFKGCRLLTSIIIPNTTIDIAENAFADCENIRNATIPTWAVDSVLKNSGVKSTLTKLVLNGGETVERLDEYRGLSGLRYVEIADNISSIAPYAFAFCSSLEYVNIGDGVKDIGYNAFSGCHALKYLTIGNSVETIGSWAFAGCWSLTSVTIPDSVLQIGERAFLECTGLVSVYLGNSVSYIESEAFWKCEALETINIPYSVRDMKYYIFAYCEKVTIYCEVPYKPATWVQSWNENRVQDKKLPVIWGSSYSVKSENYSPFIFQNDIIYILENNNATIYKGSTGFGDFVIPSEIKVKGISYDVTTIGNGAFSGCASLTAITIPKHINVVTGFSNCKELSSVTIENGVANIASGAFFACDSLKQVIIPESITKIEAWIFNGCELLDSITFEGTVAQWSEINKDDWWLHSSAGIKEVVCSDGTVSVR